ncbi:hypothetical protein NDU88_008063 [Pleurodeles waltl]|uniref:Uncharacterized protein n=1 Tax=Pleurodeles waltl TaxID=8319 RepID=A0AAV7RTN8_PLEWA|nr:hypothetical protein NDU88_008063 [Pleurodeles waltl]
MNRDFEHFKLCQARHQEWQSIDVLYIRRPKRDSLLFCDVRDDINSIQCAGDLTRHLFELWNSSMDCEDDGVHSIRLTDLAW